MLDALMHLSMMPTVHDAHLMLLFCIHEKRKSHWQDGLEMDFGELVSQVKFD